MTDSLPRQAPGIAPTRWLLLAALAVAGGAVGLVAAGGVGRDLVYYWGPAELLEAGARARGATIRLGGRVQSGSVRHATGTSLLEFRVTDGQASVPVRVRGTPPQMFREQIGVVVEGTLAEDGTFEGRRLMVSHGNEYRPPKPGEKVDPRKMMRSLQEDAREAPR